MAIVEKDKKLKEEKKKLEELLDNLRKLSFNETKRVKSAKDTPIVRLDEGG